VFPVLTGPLLWTAHFLFSYGLLEIVCQAGRRDQPFLNDSVLTIQLLVATLAATAATLVIALRAYRKLVTAEAQDATRNHHSRVFWQPVEKRSNFMALLGVGLNVFFGLAIVLSAIPILTLHPC
jgi:hypothetical protein